MNRNTLGLVFNKARSMSVVAPEIAKGAHKSSQSKHPSPTHRQALVLQFVSATGAQAGMISCAHAQAAVANAGFETGHPGGLTDELGARHSACGVIAGARASF